MKLITSMNQITLDNKLGTVSSSPHITIVAVQRCCVRLGHGMPNYFISALQILSYHFMRAAPLHTYMGDFITLHLYVPLIRDMKSLKVLPILSNYAL